MRHDKLRKLGRNKAIIVMHNDNPNLSMQEIADTFEISKQRVSQIIKKGR